MKKILVTTLVASALVTSAFAQGAVTMNASGTKNPIQYSLDGTTLVKAPIGSPSVIPGHGNLNVALYSAPVGTSISLVGGVPDLTGWTKQASPLLQTITAAAGTITSVGVILGSGTAGQPVELTVVGWTGSATDFATAAKDATALIGWTGSALSTGGLHWTQDTGTDLLPAALLKSATAYNGLALAPIPEPSMFALAGLGAAALLIFRRRK